ncbi:MAG: thrombospondin type 3 repeat-containing protein [Anaerolineales bacterium]|nr:thrombospondin type 3 repeat-containing protein [Anaerolineales bacterium]
MRHRSFITALTLLVVLMIISCSLGARLPTPTATTPPAALFDSDGDRVPDAGDNCPITPNPDQADADANGLGDPCDAPFLDGFAYLTPQGVVQSSVDERLRPAKIVAPDGTITFVWSEDASRVDLIVEAAGESETFTLEIDLSDAALLAALDATEAETGQDLSALRAWIAENPGLVLAVARGEQPPPRLAPTPGSSLPAGKFLLAIPKNQAAQDQQTDMDDYMDSLAFESLLAQVTYNDYVRQYTGGDSPAWRRTINRLLDRREHTAERFDDQNKYCILDCNPRCYVNCGWADLGTCFTDYPRIRPCFELTQGNCELHGGVFRPGQTCPGACWGSVGGVSTCVDWMEEKWCMTWPSRANIPGHGYDLTILAFCPGQACSEPMCSQPVP